MFAIAVPEATQPVVEQRAPASEDETVADPAVVEPDRAPAREDVETSAPTHDLDHLLTHLATLSGADLTDAARIDQIAALERLKSAACAAQARITVAFDASQRSAAAARGVPAAKQGQGIADQVALARRESPHRGSVHVGMAKALVREMPHTLAALTAGETNEWRATVMVRETAALSAEHRADVDADLGPKLNDLGDRDVAVRSRAAGYHLEPESLITRTNRAHADRCVTVRPAPETMTYLTGLLPVGDGVAVFASLKKQAETLRATGDERSMGQLMADLLVSRVTGRPDGAAQDVEVHLVMSDRTMGGDPNEPASQEPATVTGFGPIPAWLARRLVAQAPSAWVRRLFAAPDGRLVGADSHRRLFTAVERDVLVSRDQFCRTPWCNAPIRHADHVRRHADGGETSFGNGQGLCERCNLVKESPGWSARVVPGPGRHRTETTTPTGHTYRSTAPPLVARHLDLEPIVFGVVLDDYYIRASIPELDAPARSEAHPSSPTT